MIPKNPYTYLRLKRTAWDDGFADLIAWLFSPCTEHPYSIFGWRDDKGSILQKHRYLCSGCMKELEEAQNG